jgi:hypothetical protein
MSSVKPYVERPSPAVEFGEIVLLISGERYACPNCDLEIDSCLCACPYCAENENCDCVIGYDKATGG